MDSCSPELALLIEQWLEYDFDAEDRQLVESLVARHEWPVLDAMMHPRIAFGTAGLRGKMSPGFFCMNSLMVMAASQGLATAVLRLVPDARSRGVIVGYDGRRNSRRFASVACQVFRHAGFRVLSFGACTGTPFVPYGVRKYALAAGVMVTASHNPKDDNGYKVYWANGAQIIPPVDQAIAADIAENMKPWFTPSLPRYGASDVVFEGCDLCDERIVADYMRDMKRLQRFVPVKNNVDGKSVEAPLKFCYTAMHGVGARFAAIAFETFGLQPFVPVPSQIEPDGEFPTVVFPNPEEGASALDLSFKTATETGCRVILANDPDADRLAVAEWSEVSGGWRVFSGNETALLFADYVWNHPGLRDPSVPPSEYLILAAASASKVIRRFCEVEGCTYAETLNGFKWLGNMALEFQERNAAGRRFLFAFEAEIGFLIGNMSFDKDGIHGAACMAEFALDLYRRQVTLVDRLEQLYARYGYFVMVAKYVVCPEAEKRRAIFDRMRQPAYFQAVAGSKVVWLQDLTRDYQTDTADGRATLPVSSSSQFIAFRLDSGVHVTLRTSGTEPKIKYYVEAWDLKERAVAAALAAETVSGVLAELVRPAENGLAL